MKSGDLLAGKGARPRLTAFEAGAVLTGSGIGENVAPTWRTKRRRLAGTLGSDNLERVDQPDAKSRDQPNNERSHDG